MLAITGGAQGTAIGIAMDMTEGIIARFRTMSIARASVLTGHVVGEKLTPMTLAGEHETLNKEQGVTVEGSGEDFTVNGDAKVLCGNVQTANATVYIIDTVLLPAA